MLDKDIRLDGPRFNTVKARTRIHSHTSKFNVTNRNATKRNVTRLEPDQANLFLMSFKAGDVVIIS